MKVGDQVIRKRGKSTTPGFIKKIVDTTREGLAWRVKVYWHETRRTSTIKVTNLLYFGMSGKYGWLSREGQFYPISYARRHDAVAEEIILAFFKDEWVSFPEPGFTACYSFLYRKGWIRLDTSGYDLGGYLEPSQQQIAFLQEWEP